LAKGQDAPQYMALQNFDRPRFEKLLHSRLSPTEPIRSVEFLRGREQKLEDIRRAFVAKGRHIFVHGDRGVGKTSLAQTAAFEHQSSEQRPVLLTCDPSSSFYRIAGDIATALAGFNPLATKRSSSTKISAGLGPCLTAEHQQQLEQGLIPDLRSINEAVAVIDNLARRHSKAPVIVIDEFERVAEPGDRTLFADLIKQVGDQSIPIQLIFCGVGSSLSDLLDTHHSCYRYLQSIKLERLAIDGRLEIIDDVHSAFSLTIDDVTRYRIAKISDGYPHYVHLICEKLLWEAFDDSSIVSAIKPMHFTRAVISAVASIEEHLKVIYEKATRKYSSGYEEVLWAVADDKELSRRSSDIFVSYQRIIKQVHGTDEPASRPKFNQRMNALKKPAAGKILKASRTGWYEFSENIIRGFVRLRAEQKSIELEVDHQLLGRKFSRPSYRELLPNEPHLTTPDDP
jgi:hypothetical protein